MAKKWLLIIIIVAVVCNIITLGAGNNCRIKFLKIFHFKEQTTEF